jgi:mutator protein MutT
MQKSVLLVPINREGEILLQHRSKDAPTYSNQWGFFGGSIEEGETPQEAMAREMMEELGIRFEKTELVASFIDPEDHVERYIFKAEINLNAKILKLQQKEGDDLAFFSVDEIKRLPMMTNTRLRILSNLFR